jgi:hypothetical protein
MKTKLFGFFISLCSLFFAPCSVQAQTIPPPYINYQAVLYDVNSATPNAVLANQSFQTFVNIQDELGNLLYKEEHFASTDANGLITVKMGDGVYTAGTITNFNQINWSVGKYYLVVDFNINGTISSTAPEQLVTVPYSFYSGNAGNGMTGVSDNGNGTLTFTYANGSTYTTPTLAGIQGPTGATGPQGPAGVQGANGQSAYELWLAQGNTGTVQDFLTSSAYQIWLSQGNTGSQQTFLNTLVGPTGATGPQGPQGVQGLAGNDGAPGAQGPIGLTGPQGPQGVQGTAGTNGLNALINTTTEPAGANCANGGTKIETGLDANGNGTLETGEINVAQTKYVCNGGSLQGTSTGSMQYWDGTQWITILPGANGSVLTLSNGVPTWGAPSLPIVITTPPTKTVRFSSSQLNTGGEIISDGGGTIISRGVCYSTTPNPTIANGTVSSGTSFGTYSSTILNLLPHTQYYIRAFVTTSIGTGYGNQVVANTDTLSLGDYYQGGYVVYLENIDHGLISSTGFSPVPYGCSTTFINGTSVNYGTGMANTQAFISQCATTTAPCRVCNNYSNSGYNDWYLPSRTELALSFSTMQTYSNFSTNDLWSSSQHPTANYEWVVSTIGGTTSTPKNIAGGCSFTCFRSF